MWSCWSFSQSLKPKIQSIDNELCFCFTIPQSRVIAEQLQYKAYNDSLIQVLEKNNNTQQLLISNQRNEIQSYISKTINLKEIHFNQQEIIARNKLVLNEKRTNQLKSKRKAKVLSVGLVIAATILIIK